MRATRGSIVQVVAPRLSLIETSKLRCNTLAVLQEVTNGLKLMLLLTRIAELHGYRLQYVAVNASALQMSSKAN